MKILLLSPPRRYWPFISEYDNFILPQNLPCLASSLLQDNFSVRIIDCMPLKIGWQSLANFIREYKPDIVGIGENHALYCDEVLKAFKLSKEINPEVINVAGGSHFSALAEDYIVLPEIDFIVIGEGELTLLELARALESRTKNFYNINGLAFLDKGEVVFTNPRSLIEDLDSLPHPAYHLMPMDRYGRSRYLFSPGGISIHHGRGCNSSCKFCAWWLPMAERKKVNGEFKLLPKWRTKSVAKTVDEIKLLYHKYDKKCLIFVDETWNINEKWDNDFAEAILKEGLKINYFAFMRADCILRDEKSGVFEKLVKSGLSHICIGVERAEEEELLRFNKRYLMSETALKCFNVLLKYPSVFRQATFIVGLENDNEETLMRQVEFAKKLKADYPAFHPLTPVPGTILWQEMMKEGKLNNINFLNFDWTTPILPTKYLTIEEVDSIVYKMNKKFTSLAWLMKGLFSKYTYKRRMYIWWFWVFLRVSLRAILNFINPIKSNVYSHLITPKWYTR